MTTAQTLTDLKNNFAGQVIMPGDPQYEQASTVFITKGTPAAVVRPHSAEGVAQAITFARTNNLAISVRSGGHSNAGHSTNNGGLVIDLTLINTVEVIDNTNHTVRIGGGAIWIDIARELQKHGLAISSGDTRTVGVGGLTLGGGIGWMVRKYGLALDNLTAAQIVTANGDILRASNNKNSDLFWAIRGGGGNFGVVTSFEITAHPIKHVYSGVIMYDLKELKATLTGWRDAMRKASEDLTTMLVVMPPNPAFKDMPAAIMILACYANDDETAATQAFEPLLHLGTMLHKIYSAKIMPTYSKTRTRHTA